jgi:hypothetical protein
MRGDNSKIRGQSILEILIALAVGAILIVGAVTAISSSLKVEVEGTAFQTASFLALGLADSTSSLAVSSWRNIYDLAKSPNQFYLTVSSGSFVVSSGSESVSVGNTDFTRYFTVENVSRDSNGDIEATYMSANDDPSTQKLTVVTTWLNSGGTISTHSLEKYITRRGSLIFVQTDWSEDFVEPAEVITLPNNTYKKFATSTAIATTTGAIKIQGL